MNELRSLIRGSVQIIPGRAITLRHTTHLPRKPTNQQYFQQYFLLRESKNIYNPVNGYVSSRRSSLERACHGAIANSSRVSRGGDGGFRVGGGGGLEARRGVQVCRGANDPRGNQARPP